MSEGSLCAQCDNKTENAEVYAQIIWGKPQPQIVLPKTFYCEAKMCRIQYKQSRKERCRDYVPFDAT